MLDPMIRVGLVAVAAFGALAAHSAVGETGTQSAGSPPSVPPGVATKVTYRLPVNGAVLVAFAAPPTPYAAGHRGVDLAAADGAVVVAAADGIVQFSGLVAARGVVVVRHADGVLTEYEPVVPSVREGDIVAAGELIGTVSGMHASCAPQSCLHWGARRGDLYIDPMTLLQPLGDVRLLPWP